MNSSGTELVLDGTKERALSLLGSGLAPGIVASSCGVSESYISQLLSDENFLQEVVRRKYAALQKHNERDAKYDELEDKVLKQLESQLGMIFDPMKLMRILQVLNGAKRRGSSSADSIVQQNTVVNLTLPVAIVNQFSVKKTADNQIIEAGEQKLITMQSGTLMDRLKARIASEKENGKGEGNENSVSIGTALPALSK